MNEVNDYGITAGWHLFKVADQAANKYCHAFEPSKYWLTRGAVCEFLKQVEPNAKLKTTTISGTNLDGDSLPVTVIVKLEDETPVARFVFVFVKRDHLSVNVD